MKDQSKYETQRDKDIQRIEKQLQHLQITEQRIMEQLEPLRKSIERERESLAAVELTLDRMPFYRLRTGLEKWNAPASKQQQYSRNRQRAKTLNLRKRKLTLMSQPPSTIDTRAKSGMERGDDGGKLVFPYGIFLSFDLYIYLSPHPSIYLSI